LILFEFSPIASRHRIARYYPVLMRPVAIPVAVFHVAVRRRLAGLFHWNAVWRRKN
jgi:hypothetical protein